MVEPFYLPLIWILQLLNNLLISKFYFQNNYDEYARQTQKSFFSSLKKFIFFDIWNHKNIKPKIPININNAIIK